MRFPPLIKKGSIQKKLALNLDYGATFLDIAGIRHKTPKDVQGESLLPLMMDEENKKWRTSIYYHYYEYPGWHSVRKQYGVRTETHKLIHFYGDDIDAWEMYDLVQDPHELINLYGMPQFEEMQKDLEKELKRLQKYYKDDTTFDARTPAENYKAE